MFGPFCQIALQSLQFKSQATSCYGFSFVLVIKTKAKRFVRMFPTGALSKAFPLKVTLIHQTETERVTLGEWIICRTSVGNLHLPFKSEPRLPAEAARWSAFGPEASERENGRRWRTWQSAPGSSWQAPPPR